MYRLLVTYMKEHFGDDERGRRKAWYFFPWHFDFLTRYRALPQSVYGELSQVGLAGPVEPGAAVQARAGLTSPRC